MMEPIDPREMRKLITDAAYRGDRIDGKASPHNLNMTAPLTRNVLMMSTKAGFSGEDTMTALAYYALLQYEQAMDQLIEVNRMMPPAKS